ncbi:helix-turn-helix domain-containing protein [Pseudomonas sp. Marseille-Q5115]|uniref:helix-turn-helix domain-containing protein n=1 Tax=Pseudomonas sp. Marseille-Q5115 TaxID=2866593 RepID=UPI001CE441EE|nr:transcriptional regulator [Pseudomonas sp. Marseille-Q5115]
MKMYEYKGSGLEGIYLKNGYEILQTPYGQGVRIENVQGLHRAIAAEIVTQGSPMTGHQFRFLRKEQDLVQAELAAILRVDVQTVANWEKRGPQEVPGPADIAMRGLYSAYCHIQYGPYQAPKTTIPRETATFTLQGKEWIEAIAA